MSSVFDHQIFDSATPLGTRLEPEGRIHASNAGSLEGYSRGEALMGNARMKGEKEEGRNRTRWTLLIGE